MTYFKVFGPHNTPSRQADASEEPLGLAVFWTVSVLAVFGIMVFAMLRFGLWAAMVSSCLLPILSTYLFTFDLGWWCAPGSLIILTLIVALYVYGFVISLGGRRLFVDPFESKPAFLAGIRATEALLGVCPF